MIGVIFDAYQIYLSWGNPFLVSVGLCVSLIGLGLIFVSLSDEDCFRWNWFILYTVPMLLLALELVVKTFEMQNQMLDALGIGPIYVLPGKGVDYALAVKGHWIAIMISVLAPVLSWVTRVFLDFCRER